MQFHHSTADTHPSQKLTCMERLAKVLIGAGIKAGYHTLFSSLLVSGIRYE